MGELEERGLEKRGGNRGGDIGVDDEGDGVVSGDEVFAELHAREQVALPVFGHHKNLTGRHVYFGRSLLGRFELSQKQRVKHLFKVFRIFPFE